MKLTKPNKMNSFALINLIDDFNSFLQKLESVNVENLVNLMVVWQALVNLTELPVLLQEKCQFVEMVTYQ